MNHQEIRDQLLAAYSNEEYREHLELVRNIGHDMAGSWSPDQMPLPPQGHDIWRLIRALAEDAIEDLEKTLPRPVYEIVDGAYGYNDGTRVTLLSLQEELDDTGYIVELEESRGYLCEKATGDIVAWRRIIE